MRELPEVQKIAIERARAEFPEVQAEVFEMLEGRGYRVDEPIHISVAIASWVERMKP